MRTLWNRRGEAGGEHTQRIVDMYFIHDLLTVLCFIDMCCENRCKQNREVQSREVQTSTNNYKEMRTTKKKK